MDDAAAPEPPDPRAPASWLRAASRRPLAVALGLLLAVSLFFLIFPGVDLAFTRLFYRAAEGFAAGREPMLAAFRKSGDVLVAAAAVGLLAAVFWTAFKRGPRTALRGRPLWLVASLIVGPGLIVNGILKDHWGRPRPWMVDQFGGDQPYVPVWRISRHCLDNCSFVGGESSSAAWLLALVVLVPSRWRWAAGPALAAYAVAISLNRIAFGAHFLSDVLISWAIMGVVLTGLYRLIVDPDVDRAGRR